MKAIKDMPEHSRPLDIQHRIVAELEAERKLVEANRDLIARFEQKMRAKLAEIWGEETRTTERRQSPGDRCLGMRIAPRANLSWHILPMAQSMGEGEKQHQESRLDRVLYPWYP